MRVRYLAYGVLAIGSVAGYWLWETGPKSLSASMGREMSSGPIHGDGGSTHGANHVTPSDAAQPSELLSRESLTGEFVEDARGLLPEEFREYARLRSKALHTSEEKARLEHELGDTSLIRRSEEILRSVALTPKWSGIQARMAAVDFVRDSLRQSGTRPEIEDAILRVILDEASMDPRLPYNVRRSHAGDKVELYQLLVVWAPRRAEELKVRVRGSVGLERLISIAERRLPSVVRSHSAKGRI